MNEVELLKSFDARVWAAEFIRVARDKGHDLDEEWMIGWFANALMRGYDEGRGIRPTILPDGSAFITE